MAKPVITTDTAGCREAVDVGYNGYLAQLRDAKDLAVSMEKFMSLSHDDQVAMGRNGRALVMKHFDDRLIAQQIYDIISLI